MSRSRIGRHQADAAIDSPSSRRWGRQSVVGLEPFVSDVAQVHAGRVDLGTARYHPRPAAATGHGVVLTETTGVLPAAGAWHAHRPRTPSAAAALGRSGARPARWGAGRRAASTVTQPDHAGICGEPDDVRASHLLARGCAGDCAITGPTYMTQQRLIHDIPADGGATALCVAPTGRGTGGLPVSGA